MTIPRKPSRIIDDLIRARQEFAAQEAANLIEGQETDAQGLVVARQDRPKETDGGLKQQIRRLKDEFDASLQTLIDASIEFAKDHK